MTLEVLDTYRIERAPQLCTPVIGNDLSHEFARILQKEGVGKIAMVTDSGVPMHFVNRFYTSFDDKGIRCKLLTIDAGEESKQLKHFERYENWLIDEGFGKRDYVFAIGGGVVTDIAGFITSTLGRGAGLISAPTTLTGMVDAGMGGKNGMNGQRKKNAIGTIHQPRWFVADVAHLQTLGEREISQGAAEVIKTGVIGNMWLFEYMEKHSEDVFARDLKILERVVRECVKYKMAIVQKDPEEKSGLREELNFGHTVAHGYEVASDFEPHGDAVAIGMIAEARLAREYGFTDVEFARLRDNIVKYRLPVSMRKGISLDRMMNAMKTDKKNIEVDGEVRIKCSLPIGLGAMHKEHSVVIKEGDMRKVLSEMYESN